MWPGMIVQGSLSISAVLTHCVSKFSSETSLTAENQTTVHALAVDNITGHFTRALDPTNMQSSPF